MKRRSLAAIALVAVLAFASVDASAAPSAAQERFEEGRALMKDGRPREAIPKFLASLAAEPTASAALNLADAYERTGQTASAYHRFRQVEELARDKDPLRAAEAKKRADALLPRLATITVKEGTKTADARVTIDGAPLERATWGTPRPYDLGSHEVLVEGRGRRINKTMTIARESDRLVVDPDELLREAAPTAGADTAEPIRIAEPKDTSSTSPLRSVGIVTAGVGLAGIAAGSVFGILAFDAKSDLEARCPQYPSCPLGSEADVRSADDRAHSLGDASTVSFIIGGGLLAAGIALYLVAPKSAAATASTRGVVVAF
jgi:hypothetical protein